MFRKSVLIKSKLFNRLQTLQDRGFFYGKHGGDQSKLIEKNPACIKLSEQKPVEPNYKFLTMDDMLVPSGSWKEHYNKRNKRYNLVFIFGVTSLIGSILLLKEMVFFNAFPPPYPFIEEEEEYDFEDDGKLECEDEDECE